LAKVADTPTRRRKRLAIVADYDFSTGGSLLIG
jgi:hypothetical protein